MPLSLRRCYPCGRTDHLGPRGPLRKAPKTVSSQATDSSRKNEDFQGQQGLAPKRAVLSNTDRERKPGLLVVEATVKGFEKL
ncbi:hypothetical protein PHMEG_00017708 [Phytophthora megakarya]|uniref:Uncharacterized protein n=1 Tax=Phytophthora megakarya TaxID=4795 RepID=A0A225VXR1_9STRA|nr:hypothetical protein PHMEG_00017708 [Phytophthora megakarya]